MANEKVLKGPYWTRNWIEAMWRFTNENFVDFDTGAVDYEALGKEEFQFRKALFFRNFKNSERAKMAFVSAEDDYKNPVENGKKGGRPKKSPQDAPTRKAGDESSDTRNGAALKSATSCDQTTADAPTREDGEFHDNLESASSANTFTADGDIREDSHAKPDGSAITRNETRHLDASRPSANIYGDAATREGADESTTVSRNMRRVPQNEAPAHGFSGGRTAQGTMSRSPEAAAQSGKAYDQETEDISTRASNSGTGKPIPAPQTGKCFATRQVPRQAEEISTGNPQPEGMTGPSHGGSVASLEARQSQARESQGRAGADSVRGTPLHRAPARSSGRKFRNKEEFMGWAIDSGLDPVDASECWDATEERGGRDADGNPVKNMKAFAAQWCRTRKENRETA